MYIKEKHLKKREGRYDSDHVEHWKYYNSSGSLSSEGDDVDSREHNRFTGWDIPHFHARMKKGELMAHTPFRSYTCTAASFGSRNVNNSHTVGNYTIYPDWISTEDDLTPHAPPDSQKWIQEAAGAIYSTGWDALTFMAELTSVKTSFQGAVRTFGKLLRKPKGWTKLSLVNGKGDKIPLLNEWLAGRYGWRTMMFDIMDITNMCQTWNDKHELLSERRGTKYSDRSTSSRHVDFTHYSLDIQTQDVVTVGVRGSVNARIDMPKILINPAATAWELLPLSFVVDWFWTVGRSIEAASFAVLETQYAASSGYSISMNRQMATEFTPKATYINGTHSQTGYTLNQLVVRQPSSVPFTPHLACKLNSFKVLDLVALVMQRIRR
jgi:hypothetical protein